MDDMQAELLALREQLRRAGQPGGDARVSNRQDAPRDIDNFMKCQPLNFRGTEGGVGLTQWIEKMESVFQINGCAVENQASKPKTLNETIELANDLMDHTLRTYAERQSNNKTKADDSFRNNHGHQQQTPKRKNVTKVYNMGTGEKKP
nr:reverse transcriptase domain-containing protein [Tanacetum cinerariifolium]